MHVRFDLGYILLLLMHLGAVSYRFAESVTRLLYEVSFQIEKFRLKGFSCLGVAFGRNCGLGVHTIANYENQRVLAYQRARVVRLIYAWRTCEAGCDIFKSMRFLNFRSS